MAAQFCCPLSMGCKQELFGITKVRNDKTHPKPCQSVQVVEEFIYFSGVFPPIHKIILLQPDSNMVPIKYKANAFFIAKILLYKVCGHNLYNVNIVFHNNHVFGNALLHKKKCQQ